MPSAPALSEDHIQASRQEAILSGAKRYFTARPCKYGHISERATKTSNCLECHRIAGLTENASNLEDHRSRRRCSAELYRERNRKSINANQRAWNAKNSDKVKARQARYRLKDIVAFRERANAAHRAWMAANPEFRARKYARAKLLHPETMRHCDRQRRARKRRADGCHTKAQALFIKAQQHDKCAYCKKPLKGKGHLDHIISLAKGGSNWPHNLQWLCITCNSRKRDLDPIVFAGRIGLLL